MVDVSKAAGFVHELDDWVVETTIADAAQWYAAGSDVALHVNISSRKFSDPRFGAWLAGCLQ